MPASTTDLSTTSVDAAALAEQLDDLARRLFERETVLAFAADAALAAETRSAIESVVRSADRIIERLRSVQSIAESIDSLADPGLVRQGS